MPNLSLVFDLLGRDISASKAFRDVGNEAERTGRAGEGVGSRISSGMKVAAAGLLGAGLIAGFKDLYNAAAESNRVGAITESVVRSTGGAANLTAKQVGDLATQLSKKVGVDDELIQSGENVLLTFTNVRNEVGKGNDVFSRATGLALDMSTVLGTDMSSASVLLGKALNDPIKGLSALSRAGVQFTAEQKDQIKTLVESGRTLDAQKIILGELQKEFGGAAAAAKTPLDNLKVSAGNLAEQVGNFLVPIVNEFTDVADGDLVPALGTAAHIAGEVLGPALHIAGDALGFVVGIGADVLNFFDSLPGPVQATIGVLGALVLFRGPLGSLINSIKDVAETIALKVLIAKDAVAGLGSAAGAAKAGAGGLFTAMGGPWGLAIAGITIGLGVLVSWLGRTDEATKATEEATKAYASALESANGVIDRSVLQAAAKAAQDAGLIQVANDLGVAQGTVTRAITEQGPAFDRLKAALEANIEAHSTAEGRSAQFGRTLDAEGQASQNALNALVSLAGQTGTTSAAQRELAGETSAAAQTAATHQASLEEEAQAASDADTQIRLLKSSLDALTGANITLGDAEAAVTLATAAATKSAENLSGSVNQNTGLLDLNTEAGAQVWQSLTRIGQADNELIATMEAQGKSTADVTARDQQLRDSFYQTALQMTGSEQAAQDLTNRIYGIPGERTTRINADTTAAVNAVNSFVGQVQGRTIAMFGDFTSRPGVVVGNAVGNLLTPMAGGVGTIVPPDSLRIVGDNMRFDEAYIPLDPTSGRSQRILEEAARRMGHVLVPADWDPQGRDTIHLAGGGLLLKDQFTVGVDWVKPTLTKINSVLNQLMGTISAGGGPLGVGPPNYQAALGFARAQAGKPYIWGGVGPGGFDCSGFMSAITRVIRGQSPYARVGATATFPWGGFAPGLGGLFDVGSFRGNPGHMAGTLLGYGVESGSGHGPMVGGRALNAANRMFTTRAHFVRDDGGLVGPGWFYNGTGDVERVINGDQERLVQQLINANLAAAGPPSMAGMRIEGTLEVDGLEARLEGVVAGTIEDIVTGRRYHP